MNAARSPLKTSLLTNTSAEASTANVKAMSPQATSVATFPKRMGATNTVTVTRAEGPQGGQQDRQQPRPYHRWYVAAKVQKEGQEALAVVPHQCMKRSIT
jgi:hypothetical protein